MLSLALLLLLAPVRCATADIYLSQSVASTNQSLGIFVTVYNCGTRKANFEVKVSVVDGCGVSRLILDSDPSDGGIAAGGALGFNVSYQTDDCVGTYTVRVEVGSSNGGKVLTASTKTFEVE